MNFPIITSVYKVLHTLQLALAFLVSLMFLIGVTPLEGQTSQSHAEHLLQKLNDSSSSYVFVAAHRGGWERDWENKAPENSLANIDKAVNMGFDVFETDLNQSKDGHFVIMHDYTVDRATNGTGLVKDLNLSQLKELKLKYTNGNIFEESVPTFEEFLRRGKGRILFMVDFRLPLQALPDAVQIVAENGMLGHVFFRLWWSKKTANILSGFIESGMPYHPNQIMFRTRTPREVKAAILQFSPNLIEVFLEYQKITPQELVTLNELESLNVARDAGVLVQTHSWGGDKEWRDLIEAGFRMFLTEKPEDMTEFLKKYGVH